MADIINFLTRSSLQKSSLPTYKRAWNLFTEFHSIILQTACYALPISPATLALFIAFLFEREYASSTVNTYVSAIGYSHRLLAVADPTKVFFILQMLKGYSKQVRRLDSRLPITLPILNRLLQAVSRTAGSPYQICQFKAMSSLAFFGFLRIGEITATGKPDCFPFQLNQLVKVHDSTNHLVGIKLIFYDFKHSYNNRLFSLFIPRQAVACPISALMHYLSLRGDKAGAVVITITGLPVTREEFSNRLSDAIRLCGLDPTRYKSHSFRIGAASYAAESGMSDTQIRIIGRWKSNAFHKYIRVQSLSTC